MPLVTLCDVHRNLGNSAEALTAIERATELAPDDPAIAASLGEVLVERGEMERATALFRVIDTGDPKIRTQALVGLAAAHKFKAEDPEPAQMDDLTRSGTRSMPMRQALLYATGKAFADQKDYAKAFEWFSTAKQEARVAFDIESHAAAFEALRKTFTRDFVQTHQAKGNTSDRPVFIVGMPRSGTTLTEQICASHPQVTGAGELRTMRKLANEVGFGDADQTKFGQMVAGASPAQIKKLAEAYLTVLKTHSRTASRVVDKMPHNYELLKRFAINLRQKIILKRSDKPIWCTRFDFM
ncbi:tetratricopeptide repeat-containing sulfotransferase family protein [Halovulum sp. GXIMD14793]